MIDKAVGYTQKLDCKPHDTRLQTLDPSKFTRSCAHVGPTYTSSVNFNLMSESLLKNVVKKICKYPTNNLTEPS